MNVQYVEILSKQIQRAVKTHLDIFCGSGKIRVGPSSGVKLMGDGIIVIKDGFGFPS